MSYSPVGKLYLVVAAIACAACGGGRSPDLGTSTAALDSPNGVSLNGVSLNGVSLNGVSLNGVSLNGVSLNGVSLNGVSLNGSQLTGVDSKGKLVGGSALDGAHFTGTLSNGGTLQMRIDSAQQGVNGANTDVWFYGVSYSSSGTWYRLCGNEPDGTPVLSVAVSGTWNYASGVPGGGSYTPSTSLFTFGCRHTGIAKCVEFGYKPWETVPGQTGTRRNHHVACTRMLRADYCGDGTPHTYTGRTIDLYDGVGLQFDTEPYWPFEAEWTPNGARCVAIDLNDRFIKAGLLPPLCLLTLENLFCGASTDFKQGAYLMDRTLILE